MTDAISQTPIPPDSRRRALVEIFLIFAVFFIQGAWPVPDVNEPYYLGQVIHYWNPGWLRGDFFIETPNTHRVFCLAFGWLSLWLKPATLAWTGRILTWSLLAWAWRRLSFAVVPRPWWAVLSAALFVCLTDRCQMAGEWVIGGVEAKGFAYVLGFLGLEQLVRNRWNRALMLLGAASAFHVLAGGWMAVAVGIAWLGLRLQGIGSLSLWERVRVRVVGRQDDKPSADAQPSPHPLPLSQRERGDVGCPHPLPLSQRERGDLVAPPLGSLWPGILGGLMLALPGLIPSLMLDWGVDAATKAEAHQIYVLQRLAHHLFLGGIRPEFILRLGLLWAFWILLGWWTRQCRFSDDQRPRLAFLRALVAAAVFITVLGTVINISVLFNPTRVVDLLRYYWFRLTDVVLPLGVALEGVAVMAETFHFNYFNFNSRRPTAGGTSVEKLRRPLAAGYFQTIVNIVLLVFAILLTGYHLGSLLVIRLTPAPPRSHKIADFEAWREACRWVATPGNVPPNARFFTPRLSQTFGWYSGHSEVVAWKNVPQDAVDILEWWRRIQAIYMTGKPPPEPRWHGTLADLGVERLRRLGEQYGADYAIMERTDGPPLELDAVYRNRAYVIYRLR